MTAPPAARCLADSVVSHDQPLRAIKETVSFENTARQRLSTAIVAALRAAHPEVFDDAEALS
jgi:hypothetical protein